MARVVKWLLVVALSAVLGAGAGEAADGDCGADPCRFQRGDVDRDCRANLTDGIQILSYLFLGGAAPAHADAADVDDDGRVDLTDAVTLFNHLFLGGPEPPAPYRAPALDPTPDALAPECDEASLRLVVVEGDGQRGEVRAELPSPLAVRLVDAGGRGVAGRSVRFRVADGDGTLLPASEATTGVNGIARVRFVLGPVPYVHVIEAASAGAAPVRLVVSGEPPLSSAPPFSVVGSPFPVSLLRGHEARGSIVLQARENFLLASVALVRSFDHAAFTVTPAAPLPEALPTGAQHRVDLAGTPARTGRHRLDLAITTARGEFVESFVFDVVDPAELRAETEARPPLLPGERGELLVRIACPERSRSSLRIDGLETRGPFRFAPGDVVFPLELPPGDALALSFEVTAGDYGAETRGELRLHTNAAPPGATPAERATPRTVSVPLFVPVAPGARFAEAVHVEKGARAVTTLRTAPPFASRRLSLISRNASALRFIEPSTGGLVTRLDGVLSFEEVVVEGLRAEFAEVEITDPASGLRLGLETVTIGSRSVAVRLVRARGADRVTFLELPSTRILAEHDLPRSALQRGSDAVVAPVGGQAFTLVPTSSGETIVFDSASGRRLFSLVAQGSLVPGVEPVVVRSGAAGSENTHVVVLDVEGGVSVFDLPRGTLRATASLADHSLAGAVRAAEDVDPVVVGTFGSATHPLTLHVLTLGGEAFAARLPDLDDVVSLGTVSGARLAVDPAVLGDAVVYQGAHGDLLLAERTASGDLRTVTREAWITEDGNGNPLLWDAGLTDLDMVTTPDGLFGIQLTGTGHAYLLDRERLQGGVPLAAFRATPEAFGTAGVEPRIARYRAANPDRAERLREARVLIAYRDGTVQLAALDGSSRWLHRHLPRPDRASYRPTWTKNIDVLLGPKNADGLEEIAVLRAPHGILRVLDLASGRVLRSVVLAGDPVDGVDPVLTPDGRYVIDVSVARTDDAEDADDARTVISILGVAPARGESAGTLDESLTIEGDWGRPAPDVDLAVAPHGDWFAYQDARGNVRVFALSGHLLAMTPPEELRSLPGVDLHVPGDASRADPDEDWADHDPDDPDGAPEGPPSPDDDDDPAPNGSPPPPEEDETGTPPVPDPPFSEPGEGGAPHVVEVVDRGEVCLCPGESWTVPNAPASGAGVTVAGGDVVAHDGNTVTAGTRGGTVQVTAGVGTSQEETYTVHVIVPERLTAASEDQLVAVDKQSGNRARCIYVPCGAEVEVGVRSCPPICVEKLSLDTDGTQAACGPITPPLEIVDPGYARGSWFATGGCRTYKLAVRCKTALLGHIYVGVVDFESVSGPDSVLLGSAAHFRARLCTGPDCSAGECPEEERAAAIERLEDEIEWTIEPPAECAGGFQATQTTGPELDLVPGCAGVFTVRARLRTWERTALLVVIDPEPEPSPEQEPDNEPHAVGEPVYTHSGEVVETSVDLAVAARGFPFSFVRRYKSQATYRGPLGRGWDFSYNEFLRFRDADGDGDLDVKRWHLLHETVYERTGDGPLDYRTPDGVFTRLRRDPSGTFSLRYPDGEVRTFWGAEEALPGRLKEIADAAGNRMRFEYTGHRLTTIRDSFGRRYRLEWDGSRITALVDFTGREVRYEYYGLGEDGGDHGDLASVRTPVVAGTHHGNDFPAGRRTVYRYLRGAAHRALHGNIVAIIRPNEASGDVPPEAMTPAVTYEYGTDPRDTLAFDRVLTMREGGVNATGLPAGGTYQHYYENVEGGAPGDELRAERRRTLLVDRSGNVTSYHFNGNYKLITVRRYSGRVDPAVRFPYPLAARAGAVRADLVPGAGRPGPDPAYWEWRYEYDRHDSVTRIVHPEGNETRFEYAFADGADPLQRGNVTEIRWLADPRRGTALLDGSSFERRRTLAYEPWTNQLVSLTDERGDATLRAAGGAEAPDDLRERVSWHWVYDYQEMPAADIERLAAPWGIRVPPDLAAKGDYNGDGRIGPAAGRCIAAITPQATSLDWDGVAIRSVVEPPATSFWQYDDHGQLVRAVDAEENVSTFSYYPARDPDGDGEALIPGGDPSGGGHLAAVVVDAAAAPGRDGGDDPEPARRTFRFRYDALGRVAEEIDGRGVVTRYERNTLGEIVRVSLAAAIDAGARGEPRAEEANVAALAIDVDVRYDANGNVTSTSWANLQSATSRENASFEDTFTYDILDRLIAREQEIDGAARARWEYRYDGNGNLILVRLPEGNEVAYTYDERDLLDRTISGADGDPAARSVVRRTYDRNGALRFLIDAEDNDGDGLPETTEVVRDGWDRVRAVIDAAGQRDEYRYDLAGNLVRAERWGASGGPTPRRSDAAPLRLLSAVEYLHDEIGRVVREDRILDAGTADGAVVVEGPLSPGDGLATTLRRYDRLGRTRRIAGDRGDVTTWSYNGAGELVAVARSDARGEAGRVDIVYDRGGNPFDWRETETDAGGASSTYRTVILFDALGRAVRSSGPDGATRYFAYDSRGYLCVAADAAGPLVPDPLGIVPGEINLPGNTTRFEVDGLGRLVARIADMRPDGRGDGTPDFRLPVDPAAAPATLDRFNPANPDGQIVELYEYDRNGRLRAAVDDRGNRTEYEYDRHDRRRVHRFADGSEWRASYDRDDHLVSITDARGVVRSLLRDGLGRVVETRVDRGRTPSVGGTVRQSVEWDGLDRPVRLLDENDPRDTFDDHVVELVHDALGSPVRETQDGRAVERRFDTARGEVQTVYPGGQRRVRRTFDAFGRSVREEVPGIGELRRRTFAGAGPRVVAERLGNGLRGAFEHDAARRIARLACALDGGARRYGREYRYDARGLIESERLGERPAAGGLRGRAYATDSRRRLTATSAWAPFGDDGLPRDGVLPAGGWSWTLDGAANWTEHSGPDGKESRAFGPLNEDLSEERDPNGNRTRDARRAYVYDAFDRLLEVWDRDGTRLLEEYTYDAFGRRVTRAVPGPGGTSTTRYVYAGWQCLEEHGPDGVARSYFGADLDDVIARESPGGAMEWLHRDVTGSVLAASDATGAIVERYEYSPFGEVSFLDGDGAPRPASVRPANANPFLFEGRRRDATGLYDFRNRVYDPRAGRFLQRDPYRDVLNSGNLYAFPGSNPLAYDDPLGLSGGGVLAWADGMADSLWGFVEENGLTIDATQFADGVSDAGANFIDTLAHPERIPGAVVETGKAIGRGVAGLVRQAGEFIADPAGKVAEGRRALNDLWKRLREVRLRDLSRPLGNAFGDGVLAAGGLFGGATAANFAMRVARLGRGGPSVCFAAGVLVLTAEGPLPIESIEAGMLVWAFEEESCAWALRPVEETSERVFDGDVITLAVAGTTIRVTEDHPFRVLEESAGAEREPSREVPVAERAMKESGIWLDAGALRPGDRVLTVGGATARIDGVARRALRTVVYNLEVAGAHTYAVSRAGVLVHNRAMTAAGWPSPEWGRNRLEKELRRSDFRRTGPVEDGKGSLFENRTTGEQVRIMDGRDGSGDGGSYQYRRDPEGPWGPAQPIPPSATRPPL